MRAQAQLWSGGRSFSLIDAPLPTLSAGEVLVALTAATVCGSDRHTISGRRSAACPSILGHEGAGVVVESRRDGVRAGDAVVLGVTSSCGTCPRCRRGLAAKCLHVRKVGHERFDPADTWVLSGTYATHVVAPAGLPVAFAPHGLPLGAAATAGCAVATVMAMLEAAGQLRGRRVLVMGLGLLGLCAAQAALHAGAHGVHGADPDPAARSCAAGMGVTVSTDVPESCWDIAFELSGSQAGARSCVMALDVGGTAVLAGTVAPVGTIDVDPEWIVRGWRTVTGVHNYQPRHLTQAVEFLDGPGRGLPWDTILGRRYGLADLPRAFAEATGLRAVVEF